MNFLKKLLELSLSTKIIIGLVLGIVVGLTFGESCQELGVLGDAFIKLLQMTILPYIMTSLIYGIGSLTPSSAKLLAARGIIIMVVIWVITIITVLVFAQTFPTWQAGSFYSPAMLQNHAAPNYIDMYIPANPFSSLANNIVPAIVFFSLAVGIALIGMTEKEALLDDFKVFTEALTRLSKGIVEFTPVGVFGITASAAGTITLEQLTMLQVYFITYALGTLILSIIILPLFITLITPFSYKELLAISKDALITSFFTANLFVVLPIITEGCQQLMRKYASEFPESEKHVEIIIPISFNFPNAGKLITMLFIPFASWYSGQNLTLADYPNLTLSSVMSFFGSLDVAIPFLLDTMHIQPDTYQLYLVSGVINAKFSTLLATMSLFSLTLVTCYLTVKPLRFSLKRIIVVPVAMGFMLYMCYFLTSTLLSITVSKGYTLDQYLNGMYLSRKVDYKVYKPGDEIPPIQRTEKGTPFQDLKKFKVLRVGYNPNALPFCFFNKFGELVGYDIAMAHKLAYDLGCRIEFVPFGYANVADRLEKDYYHIIMSCTSVEPERFLETRLSKPYMKTTLAFVVPVSTKKKFFSIEKLSKRTSLKIAVLDGSSYAKHLQNALPNVEIVKVKSQKEFLEGDVSAAALLTSAEQGAAWTVIYPKYSVVIPNPIIHTDILAYPVIADDLTFLNFINYWLGMQKESGFQKKSYDYWILGKNKEPKEPRWCLLNYLKDKVKK
jgi:Na+/H+-dicarboxylate symporter